MSENAAPKPEGVTTIINAGDTPAPAAGGGNTPPPAGDTPPPKADTPPTGDKPAGEGDKPQGDAPGDKPGDKPAGEEKPSAADWRAEFAGDDEKVKKVLERYASPKDLAKAFMEQKALISAGKFSKPLPADATPEDIAEYREANGIPDKPEGYLDKLPEGLVFGEEDKAAVTTFLNDMHGINAPPEFVSKALERYVAAQAEAVDYRHTLDSELTASTTAALKEEWKGDYNGNINAMVAFVDTHFPAEVKDEFLNARLGNGDPIFSNPLMVKAIAQLGRTLNPAGANPPPSGMDKLDSIETQIKAYEDRMKNDRTAWFKDETANQHYRELITARDRIKNVAK